jgi:hypothetical protein
MQVGSGAAAWINFDNVAANPLFSAAEFLSCFTASIRNFIQQFKDKDSTNGKNIVEVAGIQQFYKSR